MPQKVEAAGIETGSKKIYSVSECSRRRFILIAKSGISNPHRV